MDIRFKKDAVVLILARLDTYSEYLQMIGRSSRTRDACDAIMFSCSAEKPHALIQRLKSQDITPMLEYEQLVQVLSQKYDDKILIKALMKTQESGRRVKSIKDLEQQIGTAMMQKMMKQIRR